MLVFRLTIKMKSFKSIKSWRLIKDFNSKIIVVLLIFSSFINLIVFCEFTTRNNALDLKLVKENNKESDKVFYSILQKQIHVSECDIIMKTFQVVKVTNVVIFSNGQFPPNCLVSQKRSKYSEDNTSFNLYEDEIKELFVSWHFCSSLNSYPFVQNTNLDLSNQSSQGDSISQTNILVAIFCNEIQTEEVFSSFTLRNSMTYLWLVLADMSFLEKFKSLKGITLCSHILVAIVDPSKTFVNIHELYKLGHLESEELNLNYIQIPVIFSIGPYSYVTRYQHSQLFSEKSRSDLKQAELRVSGVQSLEYSYDTNIVQDPTSLKFSFKDSFAVEVLHSLELTMNFITVPIVVDSWGHISNGNWTGMISLLMENKADLGISSLADRPFRREVVDFNMPTNALRLSAFFLRPSTTTQSNALVAPFTKGLWIALFFWCWMFTFTLQIFKRFILVYKPRNFKEEYVWNFSESVQWTLGTICLQGCVDVPVLLCYRIVVIVGSLAGFIIYTAYAGTLFSFLSVTVETINSMQQLLKTNYKFSVVDSSLPVQFLSESPNSDDREIIKRRWVKPIYGSMSQASSAIKKGSFVFICDHLSGYTSLNSENEFSIENSCRIKELRIPHGEQQQGTIVQKYSPYKRIIDYQILRMWEYGLVKHWNNRYIHSKPTCNDSMQHQGVYLETVMLAFATVAIGMALSLVLFLTEISSKYVAALRKKRSVSGLFLIDEIF